MNFDSPGEQINELIDQALQAQRAAQPARNYLGGSLLGETCLRKLQYNYWQIPQDEPLQGKSLRIFETGHQIEAMAARWLRLAGFELWTQKANGDQFGFSAAGGRLRGHIDGVIQGAPEVLGWAVPVLWECKSMNARSWEEVKRRGLKKSKPAYAAQVSIYQAYMEPSLPGISRNPALFTGVNKNTSELYFEPIEFDSELAQAASDRAVSVLKACAAGETLPRCTMDFNSFFCRFCEYFERCWGVNPPAKNSAPPRSCPAAA